MNQELKLKWHSFYGQMRLTRAKERAKERGEVYYNKERLRKMRNASTVRTT